MRLACSCTCRLIPLDNVELISEGTAFFLQLVGHVRFLGGSAETLIILRNADYEIKVEFLAIVDLRAEVSTSDFGAQ